jgi:phenylalanyl-tRNA synthetase alpha chain
MGLLVMDGDKSVAFAGKTDIELVNPPLCAVLERACKAENGLLAHDSLAEKEKAAVSSVAKKRGAQDAAFRIVERETVYFGFDDCRGAIVKAMENAGLTGGETGALTAQMLADGSWRGKKFRA